MKMSEEMAVRLHRMMWGDMQRELGDNPSGEERLKYKSRWIAKHFPGEPIVSSCWLCEYASSCQEPDDCRSYCRYCPIRWPGDHCNFSYQKEPISDILAFPAKDVANDYEHVAYLYYKSREGLLSKASGLPASTAIEEHVKAIKKKASGEGYDTAKEFIAEFSGIDQDKILLDHIKAIQEKAVEEYFKKTPGAKLATMDVDRAFKQYADEQKAPIFRALAEASGLSAGNESVKAHIYEIRTEAECSGRKEKAGEIFKALSLYSGVAEGNWSVYDHAIAIMKKASNEKELDEVRKELNCALGSLNLYRSTLSYESNLPSSAPIADHIKRIREYAFSDGQDAERERIMDKIGEMLNDKSTGTHENLRYL